MSSLSIQLLISLILLNFFAFQSVIAHDDTSDTSSAGCSSAQLPNGMRTDELTLVTINITDSRLSQSVIERHFYVRVPGTNDNLHSTDTTAKKSLMVFFHGFTGTPVEVSSLFEYNIMARQQDVIMIYPEGISDFFDENGTQETGLRSWNALGTADNSQSGCFDLGYQCAFASCAELNQCNNCTFATCHDDVLFVEKIIEWAFANLCVDTSKVFVSGESNGGIMTYELVTKYPNPFTAFIVVYGSPMQGYLNFSNPDIVGKSLLHIHGLSDTTVPFNGTLNELNLLFTPVPEVVAEYARIQSCSNQSIEFQTPFDTVNQFDCIEYPNCRSGVYVVLCTYNGGHSYPPMIEEATYYFLNNVTGALDKDSKMNLKSSAFIVYTLCMVLFYIM
ncbi:uncharacterized protein LOC142353538 [Convolutriloba macropyga]|uniref:uncharacterized protein LOC142353538 n=1 Tax=Convolutriloba macropyga TaxID=536237 RepID=UPI003F5228D1